jgi:hypothetical protein
MTNGSVPRTQAKLRRFSLQCLLTKWGRVRVACEVAGVRVASRVRYGGRAWAVGSAVRFVRKLLGDDAPVVGAR